MLWTTDEEVGSRTGRPLLEAEARKSKAVFVLEPSLPGGAVKTSRKGVGEFTLEVGGVAAHAGIDPGKGVSAIHELAHMVNALAPLNDLSRGTSVNVGVIEGGTRSNVIAERARAIVDVRVPSENGRRPSCGSTSWRARWRKDWVGTWPRAAPAAGRTETSRRLLASQH
jgi:glutamate carboxypeptidase